MSWSRSKVCSLESVGIRVYVVCTVSDCVGVEVGSLTLGHMYS